MVSRHGAGAVGSEGPQPARVKGLKLKNRTPLYVILAFAALVVLGPMAWRAFGPEWIINYTHSEPYGIYKLSRRHGQLQRGQMVAFPVPRQLAEMVVERGYLNPGHPLMKSVGALSGDTVCLSDTELRINGRVIGPVFVVDSSGRSLPKVRGCRTVGPGEFFPLSTYTAKSFDGRYMDVQPIEAVIGTLEPVWTF